MTRPIEDMDTSECLPTAVLLSAPGSLVEWPFRSGVVYRIRDDGMERYVIPKRRRPPNTHRYPPKRRKERKR